MLHEFGGVQILINIHILSYERLLWTLMSSILKEFQHLKVWNASYVVFSYSNGEDINSELKSDKTIVKTHEQRASKQGTINNVSDGGVLSDHPRNVRT